MSEAYDAYLVENRDKVEAAAPAILEYSQSFSYGQVWERPGLSKRDRSLVTLAALVASQASDYHLRVHVAVALSNGVTRDEIAELLTHLTVYAGFPRASHAAICAQEAYELLAEPGDD
jgi:4-carboxymuconolactone decarboxylase